MSRLDQIRRMSDDDLILFLRRYKSERMIAHIIPAIM